MDKISAIILKSDMVDYFKYLRILILGRISYIIFEYVFYSDFKIAINIATYWFVVFFLAVLTTDNMLINVFRQLSKRIRTKEKTNLKKVNAIYDNIGGINSSSVRKERKSSLLMTDKMFELPYQVSSFIIFAILLISSTYITLVGFVLAIIAYVSLTKLALDTKSINDRYSQH